jgi:ParB/RepB/Spo0J family partition protein
MPDESHIREFCYLPLDQITVIRAERQRRKADPGDLIDSIKRLGILNPLILRRDGTLVAGERRFEAAKALGLAQVPVRFFEDLDPITAKIIELEENLKRADLPWQDQCRAIAELHRLHGEKTPGWTQSRTAKSIGLEDPTVTMYLRVFESLADPLVAQATGMRVAYNILTRIDDRKAGDAISEIMEAGSDFWETEPTAPSATASNPLEPPSAEPEPSVLLANFLEWAPTYSGPKFNLIHCDFPYGSGAFSGPQSGKDKWEAYSDSPQLYWQLIVCLGQNLDKVMAHEGHLVFWFSMEHYTETLRVFAKVAPSLAFNIFPLVWLKSDNVGVLPDPRRGPRRIYETAFLASREDRPIIRAVSNAYAAPTNKDHHPSTKPEPVLKHFFAMLVDDQTTLLDPTCGAGSALRAAECLGAKRVLGLEINEEYASIAQSTLRSARTLRNFGSKA